MTVRLVILGLLRKRPLYGYEIKHIIEDHMSDWTSIAFGSIYFALNKLAEEKFIEKLEVEQKGKRPSREVYQITDTGRKEFTRLLRAVLSDLERQYYNVDVGLAFMNALPVLELKKFIEGRVKKLEETLVFLDYHEKDENHGDQLPPWTTVIFNHSRIHFKAELEWTRELLDQLNSGKLV